MKINHQSTLWHINSTWCIFFDNRGSFLGLDLSELPFEISRCEHIHREAGHLDQDDAVLALSVHGVCVAWHRILFRHIRYQRVLKGTVFTHSTAWIHLTGTTFFQFSFTSSPVLISYFQYSTTLVVFYFLLIRVAVAFPLRFLCVGGYAV